MQPRVPSATPIVSAAPILPTAPLGFASFRERRDPVLEKLGHCEAEEIGDLVQILQLDAAISGEDFRQPCRTMSGPHRKRLVVLTARGQE